MRAASFQVRDGMTRREIATGVWEAVHGRRVPRVVEAVAWGRLARGNERLSYQQALAFAAECLATTLALMCMSREQLQGLLRKADEGN